MKINNNALALFLFAGLMLSFTGCAGPFARSCGVGHCSSAIGYGCEGTCAGPCQSCNPIALGNGRILRKLVTVLSDCSELECGTEVGCGIEAGCGVVEESSCGVLAAPRCETSCGPKFCIGDGYLMRRLFGWVHGCNGCEGVPYQNEWTSDPPAPCDPCDDAGNWGAAGATYHPAGCNTCG